MERALKIWIRRMALRWLRKLVDAADDRLHAAEVEFREFRAGSRVEAGRPEVAAAAANPTAWCVTHPNPRPPNPRETFLQWEARRNGVAPITKKSAQRSRRRKSAREFDLSFSERGI